MGRSRRDLHIHGSAARGDLRKHDKLGNISKWPGARCPCVGAFVAISLREASLRGPPMRRPGGAMARSRRDLRIRKPRGRASMARFLLRLCSLDLAGTGIPPL